MVFSNSIQRDFHPEDSEDALQMTYCLVNPHVMFLSHLWGKAWDSISFLTLHFHGLFLIEQGLY